MDELLLLEDDLDRDELSDLDVFVDFCLRVLSLSSISISSQGSFDFLDLPFLFFPFFDFLDLDFLDLDFLDLDLDFFLERVFVLSQMSSVVTSTSVV